MKNKAFTLIELLIVIAIIAILALIAVPNFLEAQTRAKVSRVKADMRSLATAIESYYVDFNHYPLHDMRYYCQTTTCPPDPTILNYAYSGFIRIVRPDSPRLEMPLNGLTTPIAYFASTVPLDPFGKTKVNNLGIDARDVSYFYYNVMNQFYRMHNDTAEWETYNGNAAFGDFGFTAGGPLRLHGDPGQEFSAGWWMMSPGPDASTAVFYAGSDRSTYNILRNRTTWKLMRLGIFNAYDPTNGTMSDGDIWRIGGGRQPGE